MTCPVCGEPTRATIARGPLLAKSEPWELYWQGIKLPATPMKVRILWPLMRFGKVASSTLDFQMGEDTGPNTLHVHIAHIRKMFREHDIPIEIVAVRGWGFELRVHPTLP